MVPLRLGSMERSAPVWGLAVAALLLLILLPLGWLGYMSVSGERGVTLAHYARVFTLIEIVSGRPAPTAVADANILTGTVQRSSYLGDAVDYQVAIDEGGIVLRVAGPPPPRVHVGESVNLRIAAASCVPLASGGSE